MVERFLRREGLSVNDAIEIDEIPGLIHLASNGLGVALVPLVEAHLPLPKNVRIVSLGESTFYREIGLLQRKQRAASPMVAHFAQYLREAADFQSNSALMLSSRKGKKSIRRKAEQ